MQKWAVRESADCACVHRQCNQVLIVSFLGCVFISHYVLPSTGQRVEGNEVRSLKKSIVLRNAEVSAEVSGFPLPPTFPFIPICPSLSPCSHWMQLWNHATSTQLQSRGQCDFTRGWPLSMQFHAQLSMHVTHEIAKNRAGTFFKSVQVGVALM